MNGASKILTVSYGTFSCTLEGFDEPFNTMKAIAEYFRDLAADDRYFGAEPATPDAAMLHKIAEREIQRRVEAKIQDNGVILRAEDAAPPRVIMPAAQATPPSPVVASAVMPAPILASEIEAAPAVESAAARLSRLRAAQSQILAPAPTVSTLGDISSRFADVEAYAEDQDAEVAPVAAPMPTVRAVSVSVPEAEPDAPPPAVEPLLAVTLPEPEPEAEPVAEPVADIDLPHIEFPLAAVVEGPAAVIEIVDQVAADPAPADDVMASLRETLAGLIGQDDQLAEDMAAASDDAPAFVAFEDTQPDDSLPEDSADLAVVDMATFDQAPIDQADLAPQIEPDLPLDLPLDLIDEVDQTDLDDLARLDGEAPVAAPIDEPLIDDAAFLGTDDEAPTLTAADLTDAEATVEPDASAPIVADKIQRARARVIKIRRLDKRPDADSLLSPEAEADLQNTLAALEAEIIPSAVPAAADTSVEAMLDAEIAAELDAAPAPVAEIETETTPDLPAESKLSVAAADDAAVDRLLAQTNTQLEVPETKRRRSAIAHLKAAVLATVADRKINPNAKTKVAEVKMDPYRKDLDQAVRPTPATERPAPLVLVSAQRIDVKRDLVADAGRPVPQIVPSVPAPQHPAAVVPVRPRRVTSGGLAHAVSTQSVDDEADDDLTPEALDNIFAGANRQSFADFADSLGADSMAELIEAAGAYCTLVLDRPSFTRPLLFQQISTMPQLAELNREDSLRGFGKLLRDGRIQKTVRGQFALSATSPILTEAKRIAG